MPILERGSYFALGVVIFMPNNVGRQIFEFYTVSEDEYGPIGSV